MMRKAMRRHLFAVRYAVVAREATLSRRRYWRCGDPARTWSAQRGRRCLLCWQRLPAASPRQPVVSLVRVLLL